MKLCPFPWMSPCVTTDGHFRVCPVSQSSLSRGIVINSDGSRPHIESIQHATDVTNADSLKNLRRRMMNGEDISDTCQRCISEEAHGLQSRRQMELVRIPELTSEFVKKHTSSDGSLTLDTPIATLIMRMGNKCNLVCRMCGPSSSSAWYKEWADTRYPGYKEEELRISLESQKTGAVKPSPDPYTWVDTESVLRLVEMCGSSLRRIHFSGGEPLLSNGHLEALRYLVSSGRSRKMSLDYNSNLTVLTDEVLELWTHFEDVEIGISIDGAPNVNEYIRYPVKSPQLVRNLKRLDNSDVKGKFWISTTVQIYNIMDLQNLESWVLEQNFKKIQSKIAWHVLRSPKELSIFALPNDIKNKIALDLSKSESFEPLAKLIFDEDYSSYFDEFLKTTKTMDNYRGQSIQSIPNLWKLLESHF